MTIKRLTEDEIEEMRQRFERDQEFDRFCERMSPAAFFWGAYVIAMFCTIAFLAAIIGPTLK